MKKVRIRVEGKVQGVFFRHYTRKKAEELGLAGWVKNEEDGSVLIVAAGENTNIEEMIAWAHQGSPLAKVTSVDTAAETGPVETEGFEVRK